MKHWRNIGICSLLILTHLTNHAVIVIPIGEHCSVAAAIRTYGIRTSAYPFDWIITRFPNLINAFYDRFSHFFEPSSLRLRGDRKGLVDYYGFEFVHDIPTVDMHDMPVGEGVINENTLVLHWQDHVPEAHKKYQRRLNRLHEIFYGTEHVYFIRHQPNITKAMALQLHDVIHKTYPTLAFSLVIVGRTPGIEHDWNIKNIRNFYLNESYPVWNDPKQWAVIFARLGLYP